MDGEVGDFDRIHEAIGIPNNYMYISSFGKDFHYQINGPGEVRLII